MVAQNHTPPAQFYDHLTQNLREGVLLLDSHGSVIATNQAAADILGYDQPAILVGCQTHDLLLTEETLTGEEVHNWKTSLRDRNGRFIPVSVTLTPVSAEVPGHRLLSITTLSEVERLNEALTRAQRLAGIGTLTSSVAHELNNPISIITATCNNLLYEAETQNLDTEKLVKYLQVIEQSAWRCARIMEVLRNYSFDDTPNMAVTDLNMIMEDALTLVRHQLQGNFNVEVKTDLANDLKTIVCDHNRMTQVMINLLNNARDAMGTAGGQVIVKTWAIPAGQNPSPQLPDLLPTDIDYVAISVSDTGRGVSPEIMNRVFEPFFTTKTNGKGTGLGLFIARRIVSQHNGRIWIENNPTTGATVTIVLPLRKLERDLVAKSEG